MLSPTLTAPTAATDNENSSLTFSTGNGNAITLVDAAAVADSDTLALSVSNGTLTLASTTGLTFMSGTNNEAAMTIWGTLADINAALSGLIYTPTTGYVGSDSLVLTAENTNNDLTGSANVALTVAAPSITAPPVGGLNTNHSVTFSPIHSNGITIADPGATAGSDTVNLTVAHGQLTLGSSTGLTFSSGANGSSAMTFYGTVKNLNAALNGLTYIPIAGFNGTDALAISLKNYHDNLSTSAIVLISGGVPQPSITAPATATLNVNTSLTFSAGNSNLISIVDLVASAGSDTVKLSATGTLTLGSMTGLTFSSGSNGSDTMTFYGTMANMNAALNGLTYTSITDPAGHDYLGILVTNYADSITTLANVRLTINHPPILIAPTTDNLIENSSLTFSPEIANAIVLFDALDSDTLELSVSHGTLTLASTTGLTFTSGTNNAASMTVGGTLADINAAIDGLIYNPTTGYFGSDSLVLTAVNTNDHLTSSATDAITVFGPPTVIAPTTATVNENSSLTFSTDNGNAISISDLAATAGSDTVTLSVTHGKLTLGSTTGIRFSSGVNGAATMTFYGTVANLNAALNGLKFTPTTGYSGPDTLAITIKNYHDNLSVSTSVAITVKAL